MPLRGTGDRKPFETTFFQDNNITLHLIIYQLKILLLRMIYHPNIKIRKKIT